MKRLLVVSPDASWNEGLRIALELAGIETFGTRRPEEAIAELNKKKGDFGGVLIGVIPAPGQSEAEAALQAMVLLTAVRRDEDKIPILLWASYPIDTLSRIVGNIKGSILLRRDAPESISEALLGLSAPSPETKEAPTGRVEMEIGTAAIHVIVGATGKGVVTDMTRGWTGRNKLASLEQKFRSWELRRRSGTETRYADDWDQTFQETGEDLADELAYSAEDFRNGLAECLTHVGTLDNIHFRFSLRTDSPETTHRFIHVPFELLYDKPKKGFVRSLAPIARRICLNDASRTATPLASAPSPSGPMLFVKSNAHGALVVPGTLFGGKANPVLPKLAALDEEFKGVRDARAEATGATPPEELALTAGEDCKARLREAMHAAAGQTPKLQILHFAGHSVCADDGTVFLILPGKASGRVVALDIGEFAGWARRCEVPLVILSSCQSSSPDAVSRLAQAGIPAVIGFRWEVDDNEAAFFTRSLHRHLAKPVSVARAFHRAISEIQNECRRSPTFASPMLVVQNEEWTI